MLWLQLSSKESKQAASPWPLQHRNPQTLSSDCLGAASAAVHGSHCRAITKPRGIEESLVFLGLPCAERIGKPGLPGENPTERTQRCEARLDVEANASRQLFPAPALPSNMWHPALAARMADGQGSCPNSGPCQTLPPASHPLLQSKPFPRMSCFCTSPQRQHQAKERVVTACVHRTLQGHYTAWFSSSLLSAGLPR